MALTKDQALLVRETIAAQVASDFAFLRAAEEHDLEFFAAHLRELRLAALDGAAFDTSQGGSLWWALYDRTGRPLWEPLLPLPAMETDEEARVHFRDVTRPLFDEDGSPAVKG